MHVELQEMTCSQQQSNIASAALGALRQNKFISSMAVAPLVEVVPSLTTDDNSNLLE